MKRMLAGALSTLAALGSGAAALAVLQPADAGQGQVRPPHRQIPVTVVITPTVGVFAPGEPILLDVELRNGLDGTIDFQGFGTAPNDWNAETYSVTLVDIRRGGDLRLLYEARPEVTPPPHVAGLGRRQIQPGDSLTVRIDARKWRIHGGWIPGRYEVDVRVDHLRLDDFATASIKSEMAAFEVR